MHITKYLRPARTGWAGRRGLPVGLVVLGALLATILPAIAMIGVLAGLTNAFAFDQQATGPEMDNALNWQAARGDSYSGAHAQAPFHEVRDSGSMQR